jgi:hypothetical protein
VIARTNEKIANQIIEPNVDEVGLADLNRYKDCIEAGVLAGRQSVPELKRKIINQVIKKLKGPAR